MGATVSLHGRALGFDSETLALIRNGVEGNYGDEAVSAAGSATIVPRGTTTFSSTVATTYVLDAPIVGLLKTLVATGASTIARTVTLASGTYQSTTGSTLTKVTLSAVGQSITLRGLSTAIWQVIANTGAACT